MDMSREPQRLIPALEPLYQKIVPLGWPLVRLAAGLIIIPHGWPKLMMGVEAAANMALVRRGIQPALPLAYILIFLETVGGLCVALGLFTRFFAGAIAIEMAVIVYHHLDGGFGWTNRGYEYPLMWGAIMLAIALRGGGPYSLDRRIGKEL
jgi:putative oxidoreductase